MRIFKMRKSCSHGVEDPLIPSSQTLRVELHRHEVYGCWDLCTPSPWGRPTELGMKRQRMASASTTIRNVTFSPVHHNVAVSHCEVSPGVLHLMTKKIKERGCKGWSCSESLISKGRKLSTVASGPRRGLLFLQVTAKAFIRNWWGLGISFA